MVDEIAQHEKDPNSLLPRFIYFYFINPSRLETTAKQLLFDVKVCFVHNTFPSSLTVPWSDVPVDAPIIVRLRYRNRSQGRECAKVRAHF